MEAQNFVAELLANGLTQSEIAERTRIPQPTISKIFRGIVDDVLSKNYRRLQEVYAVERKKAKGQWKVPAASTPTEQGEG